MITPRFNTFLVCSFCLWLSIPAWSNSGGIPVSPGEFRQTVALVYQPNSNNPGKIYCSGTLIGPSTVLSAAHCFPPDDVDQKLTTDQIARGIHVYVGDSPNKKNIPFAIPNHQVAKITIDPDYQGAAIANDFMLLELSENIDLVREGINPAPIRSQITTDQEIISVGYGMSRAGQKKGLKTYFKAPIVSYNHAMFSVGRAWVSGPSGCHGDSGGSAYFEDSDGERYFVGVTTGMSGDPNCGADATHYQLITSEILEWIRSVQPTLFE